MGDLIWKYPLKSSFILEKKHKFRLKLINSWPYLYKFRNVRLISKRLCIMVKRFSTTILMHFSSTVSGYVGTMGQRQTRSSDLFEMYENAKSSIKTF